MTLRNWAGNITFSARQLHRPRTVDELQHLVAGSEQVRALGTGHSFNRVADTRGELISVAGLDVPIAVDANSRTVEVGAGTRFGELTTVLQDAGWALHNLGSLPHISIAGACATGTHGSGDGNPCLADAVRAVEFVRADGELISVAASDPDFGGAVLSLGALGIATKLTLAIRPSYDIRQDVWLDAPLPAVLDRFAEIMAAGYSVSLFTTWARPGVIDQVWVKSRTDGPLADGREWGARAADAAQHPITGQDGAEATQQLGIPGPWNARLPHFRIEFTPSNGEEQQSEYLVARADGPAALAAIAGLDLHPALQVCEVRTVAADRLWLSPFRDRAAVGLHFTWVDDDALVGAAVEQVEAALAPFAARPHWGKLFSPDFLLAAREEQYPLLGRFRELAARHDPDRRFGNDFLEQFVY